MDPLSQTAQRLTPVLMNLRSHFNVDLRLFLHATPTPSDIPLKAFSRFVLEPLTFEPSGALQPSKAATFANLPQNRLLTMTIQVRTQTLLVNQFIS